jgi:CRP-like cAMP-binding protein
MVLSGDLKAECEDNTGKPIIMRVSRLGEYLGMEVILPGRVYLMSVSAIKPSEICAIPVSSVEEVIFSNKEACITLMSNMKNKIEQLFKYTLVMITGSAQSRLAFALLSLGGNEGRVSISKEEIARMTGLTRETVSRKLGLFNSEKLIEFHQRDVQILRPDALKKLTN